MRTTHPEATNTKEMAWSNEWPLSRRDEATQAELCEVLSSWAPRARVQAARQLARKPDVRAIPALSRALRLCRRRHAAAELFWLMGSRWIRPARRGDPPTLTSGRILYKLGEICRGYQHERTVHANALASIGPAAVPTLRRILQHPDAGLRSAATGALGRVDHESAIPALCDALQDQDIAVRTAAARALDTFPDSGTLPLLGQALRMSFLRRSARQQRISGWLAMVSPLAAGLIAVGVFVAAPDVMRNGWGMGAGTLLWVLIVAWIFRLEAWRDRVSLMVRVIARKAETAEPSPELRLLAEDLRALGADDVYHFRSTRRLSVAAAERIEASIAELKDLPVASQPPDLEAGSLPRPTSVASDYYNPTIHTVIE